MCMSGVGVAGGGGWWLEAEWNCKNVAKCYLLKYIYSACYELIRFSNGKPSSLDQKCLNIVKCEKFFFFFFFFFLKNLSKRPVWTRTLKLSPRICALSGL